MPHNDGTFAKRPTGINTKKPALSGKIHGRNNTSFTVKSEKHFNKAGIWLPGSALKPEGSAYQRQRHEGVEMNSG